MDSFKSLKVKPLLFVALALSLSGTLGQREDEASLQLACLERDWFSLFARQDHDITGMEVAEVSQDGRTRLAVAITDFDGGTKYQSRLAYMDYISCESLFFIGATKTYEAGLNSLAVDTQEAGETIYWVGKEQGEDQLIVTKVKDGNAETFSFDFSAVDYSGLDVNELDVQCQLHVIEPNLLVWTHPLGSVLVDLDYNQIKVFRHEESDNLLSLATLTTSYRYVYSVAWQQNSSADDQLWVEGYDLSRLSGSSSDATLILNQSFSLGASVSGPVSVATTDTQTALCYADDSGGLNFAFFDAASTSDLSITSLSDADDSFDLSACVSVTLSKTSSTEYTLTALIATSDYQLGYVYYELSDKRMEQAAEGASATDSLSLVLSEQRFFMFSDWAEASRFRVTPSFIGMRSSLYGVSDYEWAFLLNREGTGLRQTTFWADASYFYQVDLTYAAAVSESVEYYSYLNVKNRANSGTFSFTNTLERVFVYNYWIGELCDTAEPTQTLLGESYELDYPHEQLIEVLYGQLINTELDQSNPWLRVCYPSLDFKVPSSAFSKFQLYESSQTRAEVSVKSLTEADVHVTRNSLLGVSMSYFERVRYQLRVPIELANSYQVAYVNDMPRIVDPEPFNNEIFVSLKWAPNPLKDPESLIEDIEGIRRDLLWRSGPIVDTRDDRARLELIDLSTIFDIFIAQDNRVEVRMAQQMKVRFTGKHVLRFALVDDGEVDVKGPQSLYTITIVLGLYKADPIPPRPPVVKPILLEDDGLIDKVVVPQRAKVHNYSEWINRRDVAERKAQLRVHPISSEGHLQISFTKPVKLPADALDRILADELIQVSFEPSTYDYEESEGETEIKDWQVHSVSDYSIWLNVTFENPNLLGYSIHESDKLHLVVDLTSLIEDDSGEELYGKFIKGIPLQYPAEFSDTNIQKLHEGITYSIYIMLGLLGLCFLMLTASSSLDQAAVVWLVLGSLQLAVFLPLVNVPVPSQVNDISKEVTRYLRLDLIEHQEQSLTEHIAWRLFDFQAWDYEVPMKLEQLGFESRNFFSTAAGLNLLQGSIVTPVLLFLLVFGLGKCKWKRCGTPFAKLRSLFNMNFYVRFNLEMYMVYSLSMLLNAEEATFYNWAVSLQSVISGLYLLLLASLPISIIFFYNWSYERLATNPKFRAAWGSLYLGLVGESDTQKSRMAYKYPALLVTRKFGIAFFFVVMHEYWVLQMGFIFLSSTLVIYVTSLYSPYQTNSLNKLQIFNDCALIVLGDFMIAFNGGGFLSSNQSLRFNMGWAYVGFLLVSQAISFLALINITIRTLIKSCTKRQFKKSKEQLRLERRKTRAARRQSIRMNNLLSQSQVRFNNVIPVMNLDGSNATMLEGSMNNSLNSPSGQIVLQNNENLLQVKIDNEQFKKQLTQIQENLSDEEEDSSSFAQDVSDITSSLDSLGALEPPQFVMGLSMLPKINRSSLVQGPPKPLNQLVRSKNPLEPSNLGAGHRRNRSQNRSEMSLSRDEIVVGQLGPYNSDKKPSRQYNRTLHSDSSEEAEGSDRNSFKQSRLSANQSGYRTGKFHQSGSSFSNQVALQVIPRKRASSNLDDLSQKDSSRALLFSQASSRRGAGKKGSRGNSRTFQRHGGMSRRSSNVLEELDDAVSHRLEQIAEMRVARRQQSSVLSNSESQESKVTVPKSRKSGYVMGQRMARDSMVADMAGSILIMSKVHHENSSEKSPFRQHRLSHQSSFEFNMAVQDQDYGPRNLKKQLQNDSHQRRGILRSSNSMGDIVPFPRAVMSNPTTPPMEQVAEAGEEPDEMTVINSPLPQPVPLSARKTMEPGNSNWLVDSNSDGVEGISDKFDLEKQSFKEPKRIESGSRDINANEYHRMSSKKRDEYQSVREEFVNEDLASFRKEESLVQPSPGKHLAEPRSKLKHGRSANFVQVDNLDKEAVMVDKKTQLKKGGSGRNLLGKSANEQHLLDPIQTAKQYKGRDRQLSMSPSLALKKGTLLDSALMRAASMKFSRKVSSKRSQSNAGEENKDRSFESLISQELNYQRKHSRVAGSAMGRKSSSATRKHKTFKIQKSQPDFSMSISEGSFSSSRNGRKKKRSPMRVSNSSGSRSKGKKIKRMKSQVSKREKGSRLNDSGEEDSSLRLERMQSSLSRPKNRPADMPRLNLAQKNLLQGISKMQPVKKPSNKKQQVTRTLSNDSDDFSLSSKFDIEDGTEANNSTLNNVKFMSMHE